MGVNLDGHGNVIDETNKNKDIEQNTDNTNTLMFNVSKKSEQIENKQNFKEIKEYKPSGNFIYNQQIFRNIEDKFK
jgi:adenylate kinase